MKTGIYKNSYLPNSSKFSNISHFIKGSLSTHNYSHALVYVGIGSRISTYTKVWHTQFLQFTWQNPYTKSLYICIYICVLSHATNNLFSIHVSIHV